MRRTGMRYPLCRRQLWAIETHSRASQRVLAATNQMQLMTTFVLLAFANAYTSTEQLRHAQPRLMARPLPLSAESAAARSASEHTGWEMGCFIAGRMISQYKDGRKVPDMQLQPAMLHFSLLPQHAMHYLQNSDMTVHLGSTCSLLVPHERTSESKCLSPQFDVESEFLEFVHDDRLVAEQYQH
ncbi:hypothetical protein F5141DRAFT_1201775 [Pisolithus sp. B1]|nr:hypothetical protein F5141DRAFT_1201775 [Pisolithus sp. B1]